MSDEPIFIVGSPRSGTTLLRDLLRAHPRLTFPYESQVIPALYRAYGDPADAVQARHLAAALLGSWDIATWRLELEPGDLEHHRSFAGLVADLYASWAAQEGKPRWGEKTPLYVHDLDVLLTLFPGAQIIHIVRDGRDVALSLMRQPWGPPNAYTAARMWTGAVRAGLAAARKLPSSRLLEVRYEELLAAPEAQLRGICDFLEETFDEAMLTPNRLPAPSGRRNPLPRDRDRRVDRANSGRWSTAMSAGDRVVFESVAGETLTQAGYPLSASPRRLHVLERAAWRLSAALHFARWRATTWDRSARARTTLILLRGRAARFRPGFAPRR